MELTKIGGIPCGRTNYSFPASWNHPGSAQQIRLSPRRHLCRAEQGNLPDRPGILSKDIEATLSCARALGAQIQRETDAVRITGIGNIPQAAALDCEESGSTLRFFLPIAAALGIPASFSGKGKLPDRPLEPLAAQMRAHGVCFSPAPALPFSISGRLAPGRFSLAGNVSSQFITGLLFALPLARSFSSPHWNLPAMWR